MAARRCRQRGCQQEALGGGRFCYYHTKLVAGRTQPTPTLSKRYDPELLDRGRRAAYTRELHQRGRFVVGRGTPLGREDRQRLPETLRQYVIERDGLTCRLCGDPVEPDDVHIDHVFPRVLGGDDSPANLQVAHSTCNLAKGARLVEELRLTPRNAQGRFDTARKGD